MFYFLIFCFIANHLFSVQPCQMAPVDVKPTEPLPKQTLDVNLEGSVTEEDPPVNIFDGDGELLKSYYNLRMKSKKIFF
jgi:hypothetical protein